MLLAAAGSYKTTATGVTYFVSKIAVIIEITSFKRIHTIKTTDIPH